MERDGLVRCAGHFPSVGIQQAVLQLAGLRLQRGIGQLCLHMDGGRGVRCCQLGIGKRAEGRHADRRRLQQPCVAIDAGTLVEPALLQRGIGTDADQVVAAHVRILRHVVHLGGIAAGFLAQPEAVEPHLGMAEDAVELQQQPAALIGGRQREMLPVPAHAGCRIAPAHGLVAVRVAGLAGIRELGGPVVGHAHILPRPVVELRTVGTLVMDGVGLGQIVEVLRAAAEVLLRVGGMAQAELPAVAEPDFLADVRCIVADIRCGLRRCCQHHQHRQQPVSCFRHHDSSNSCSIISVPPASLRRAGRHDVFNLGLHCIRWAAPARSGPRGRHTAYPA